MPAVRVAALVKAGITSLKDIPPRPPAKTMEFQLFDPLKRFACFRPRGGKRKFVPAHLAPRIRFLDDDGWAPPVTAPRPSPPPLPPRPPQRDDELNAHRLVLRLRALKTALDDIPAQAKRLAIWRAKRERDPETVRPKRFEPLRGGPPPGHRKRRTRDIDEVLHQCHFFAREVLDGKPERPARHVIGAGLIDRF